MPSANVIIIIKLYYRLAVIPPSHGRRGATTVLVKTAITGVTPPVVFNSFPLPVTHLTAVEPPRDRRRVASLHFRDCTAVVLRRHGGDGGATAGERR